MDKIHNVFPEGSNKTDGKNNIAIQVFGNRLFSDQTLYEFLIEFLLVFVSPKDIDHKTGEFSFHSIKSRKYEYYVQPRMGLKRFIFFDRSKRDTRFPVDERAYHDMCHLVIKELDCGDKERAKEAMYALQDVLYGYAAVLKNRSWMAQSVLPITPELIFPEAMPAKKVRINMSETEDYLAIDTKFVFDKHNFMARGGEVYYLHLLQGLELYSEYRIDLESLLKNLVSSESRNFSKIATWLQGAWEKERHLASDDLWVKKPIGFIPASGYLSRAKYTLDELKTFLSTQMHPITKIELLSKGIIIQIMRMMCLRAQEYGDHDEAIPWIIDMRAPGNNKTLMQLSAHSYKRTEEVLVDAINKRIAEFMNESEGAKTEIEYLAQAKTHTLNLFKRLGKNMHFIIPPKGGNERYSIPEDLARFFVLSIIPPGKKITFDAFLQKMYEHFGIVIGPVQYRQCAQNVELDVAQTNCFVANAMIFQDFLKNIGFLRDLSDATAIVANPYEEVVIL